MSITKSQLKSIVKECLVEILSEGIGSSMNILTSESKKMPLEKNISYNNATSNVRSTRGLQDVHDLKQVNKRESKHNNMMSELLADTAKKTLPAMLENENNRQPIAMGTAERIIANNTPEELFGSDIVSKWANLAFTEIHKK